MAQELGEILEGLGMPQYLDVFLDQGFDTWETVLDITESDLESLSVKLGHRRKLQRQIATTQGIGLTTVLVSRQPYDVLPVVENTVVKRKYRRHPKRDENAPERPASAFILFSNKVRAELKDENLSFSEIAKLVGENWQSLPSAEKEPFESQAAAAKTKYNCDLAEYKKTPQYQKYHRYLQEFKRQQGSAGQGLVRPQPPWDATQQETLMSGIPKLTKPRAWKARDVPTRPRIKPRSSHHGSTTSAAAASTGESVGSSESENHEGSEPPPTTQQRIMPRVALVELPPPMAALPSPPQQSRTGSSQTLTHFEPDFGCVPWEPRDPSRRERSGSNGAQHEESKHQHLPPLSHMSDKRHAMSRPSRSPKVEGHSSFSTTHQIRGDGSKVLGRRRCEVRSPMESTLPIQSLLYLPSSLDLGSRYPIHSQFQPTLAMPAHRRGNPNLDGLSVLLKAGEIARGKVDSDSKE